MSDLLDSFAPDVDFSKDPEPEPETPAAAAPEPEAPKAEEPPAAEPPKAEEPPKPKLVPLEALHESRMKEREWRQKAEAIERESAERFQKLEQRLEKLANPPPPVPDFATDPAGHLMHEVTTTRQELAAVRQQSDQARQAQETAAFEQQIAQSTQAAEQAFAKDHPDYLDAVRHLQQIADKNMEMMGIEDPAVRQAQIRKDALAMSLQALKMGKSPAEVAYQLAQNYGYRAGPAAANTGEATRKIIAMQEGQKAGASMPAGGTKQSSLTLAALETMDDDEFNRLIEDDASWKKLVRQMG